MSSSHSFATHTPDECRETCSAVTLCTGTRVELSHQGLFRQDEMPRQVMSVKRGGQPDILNAVYARKSSIYCFLDRPCTRTTSTPSSMRKWRVCMKVPSRALWIRTLKGPLERTWCSILVLVRSTQTVVKRQFDGLFPKHALKAALITCLFHVLLSHFGTTAFYED